ncbi:MAG: S-layer homology domain-containing protein [Candidatus Gastranaerophilales bacterium]|nr:S-layer homology domain-containing protein [Candidatus Gastranaerophilales bacterium]
MTIRKILLTATMAATVFAFTVPVSFAACSTGGACPVESTQAVTPDTATCHKCKEKKQNCKCKKEKRAKKCDPCQTGAAAPCDSCKQKADDCKCKKDKCQAPCYEHKDNVNLQTYSYPNAVYSPANNAVLGEFNNSAIVKDNNGGLVAGVPVEDRCITGAAAPVLDEKILPKSDCCPEPNIQSPNTMKATYKEIEPCLDKKSDCGCATGAASGIFGQKYPDVPNGYWASDDINRLTEQCVVVGYPDNLFKPNKNISRAEMASMVVKGYNLENTPMTTEGDFKDVSKNHWGYEAINKGVSSDMLAGHPDGKFYPNNPITRSEAMTIISKGINCPMDSCKADEILGKYQDGAQVPSWARECVAKAIDNGALKDSASSKIRPQDKATRAEVSSMLQNVRVAGGYDVNQPTKTAIGPSKATFVEKETPVCIPTLSLEMKDIINAKNANVGERFAAVTTHEITINGVTYPAGSKVYGKVTEVIRPSKCDDGGLKLSFNEIAGCDGCKQTLPKQVLSARVEKQKDVNGIIRFIEMPFTFVGSTLGNVGRTVGGMLVGLGNASEALFDQVGTGTGELFQGNIMAAGRSYGDGIKTTFKAPVDLTRTALSGTMGLFQNTGDELTYLVDGSGNRISRVNPKEKVTIAFGNN